MNKDFQIDANSEGEAFIVHEGNRTKLEGAEITVADEKITMASLAQDLQALRNENKYLKRQLGLEEDPQAEVTKGAEGVAPQTGDERYPSTEVDPKAKTGGNNTTDSASEVAKRTKTEVGKVKS